MSVLIGTRLNDTLVGAADSDNTIFGDPPNSDSPFPPTGNDHLTGGSNSTNLLSGDQEFLNGGVGSADVLIGGESATNSMFGDASDFFITATGGDDVLTGGNDSVNTMAGDAGGGMLGQVLRDGLHPSFGGNDTLLGGVRSANTMFGDTAGTMELSFGGDDTLVAGDGGTNTLIGDALILAGDGNLGSTGGDDLLVSGTATDDMWGDGKQLLGGSIGGADVFRFLADNGNDFIHDFERGKDLIDLTAVATAAAAPRSALPLSAVAALGRADLDGLVIEEIDADGDGTTDSVIHLGDENSVTVRGVTGLSAADFVVPPSSYVLFSRTSTGAGHRDEWVGSEANSQPSTTPGSTVPASTFDADLATGPGTVLAGGGAADYAADGILQNANLALFNLTETPSGTFATEAPADLAARIVAGTPFFGTANTDLDPAQSDIDLAAGKLHLAQTAADRNGIKNLEISLDSATSLRDIRLENFVDTRLKLGGFLPHSDQPPGERFEVHLLGAKRGEVDASEAPQAMDLLLASRTNDSTFQNSFVIKGSRFDDTVTIEAGKASGNVPRQGNTIVGESSISTGETGGNDTLTGGGHSSNTILGDAFGDLCAATGGNDTLTGGANSTNVMSGDTPSSLRASGDRGSNGGNDVLIGGANSTNTMYGDAGGDVVANRIRHNAGGGNDVLTGGANSTNVMYGDAGGAALGGSHGRDNASPRGGMDTLTGGDNSVNTMVGDFRSQSDAARGGSDVLIGGAHSTNTIMGDVEEDAGGSVGDDTIVGGDNSTNTMFGDARGSVISGGSDRLIGGANSTNVMFGDVGGSASSGGNDTLVAGADGSNVLVGDAGDGLEQGGDDLLVSSTGTDDMWGDSQSEFSKGGHDVFRFAADNGDDVIHDFERGTDLIEVDASFLPSTNLRTGALLGTFTALALPGSGELSIEERDANGDGTTDSIIHFDAQNSVTVLGVTGLTSEDFVAAPAPGIGYVLFGRTSAPIGTRDEWLGSEANSQPNNTPGNGFRGSAFNADTATAAGTVLAGAGFADYAADGILSNANVAIFDLTEAILGAFATGAAADLETKIASSTPLFGAANTDLDPAHSNVDAAVGELHLAQTDADWSGIKNLEVSLDSTTSLRDIRLENFVDTRLKIGDRPPNPDQPVGDEFDVHLLGTKRGEVDASHAPQAINLLLEVWTNSGFFQNSFDIKGSAFGDVVNVRPGNVTNSRFGQSESWYQNSETPPGILYVGEFTTVSVSLGEAFDVFDAVAEFNTALTEHVQFRTIDHVWGGSGGDVLYSGYGDDRLFGDEGSGAWRNDDPPSVNGFVAGNDHLEGGPGADWLEGNRGDDSIFCGATPAIGPLVLDGDPDVVNFNDGDGSDRVLGFEPGTDVLRIANVGALTQQVVSAGSQPGLLIQNGAGRVLLVEVITPLNQSVDGSYLLLS